MRCTWLVAIIVYILKLRFVCFQVHRDLKPENVVFFSDLGMVKVSAKCLSALWPK